MANHFVGDNLTGRIEVDGKTFEKCIFTNADVVYSGGDPPALVGCTFNSCRISFSGAAARTLAFMTAMYSGGFQPVIDQTIQNIRKGAHPG